MWEKSPSIGETAPLIPALKPLPSAGSRWPPGLTTTSYVMTRSRSASRDSVPVVVPDNLSTGRRAAVPRHQLESRTWAMHAVQSGQASRTGDPSDPAAAAVRHRAARPNPGVRGRLRRPCCHLHARRRFWDGRRRGLRSLQKGRGRDRPTPGGSPSADARRLDRDRYARLGTPAPRRRPLGVRRHESEFFDAVTDLIPREVEDSRSL